MSSPSNYLSSCSGNNYVVSNVNPFTTQLTTSNSNINGCIFTPAAGDWIYYLFYFPSETSYITTCSVTSTITPSPNVSSVNFIAVGAGSGGNAGNETYGINNASGFGITYAGGSSGGVCAGSMSINTTQYIIAIGAGGVPSGGSSPPQAGGVTGIIATDGGYICCGGGSPVTNKTGITGTVSSLTSTDLSNLSINYNSNNVSNYGIGGSNNFDDTSEASGCGLSVTFADGSSFLFGGGGGGGGSYTTSNGTTGSNGLGGQGGSPGMGGSGGGGGGGVINIFNVAYIGTSINGGNSTSHISGNGGGGGLGGGGGGSGIQGGEQSCVGGYGGNGIVLLYYQIPTTATN